MCKTTDLHVMDIAVSLVAVQRKDFLNEFTLSGSVPLLG
jgi:hypothetical protein